MPSQEEGRILLGPGLDGPEECGIEIHTARHIDHSGLIPDKDPLGIGVHGGDQVDFCYPEKQSLNDPVSQPGESISGRDRGQAPQSMSGDHQPVTPDPDEGIEKNRKGGGVYPYHAPFQAQYLPGCLHKVSDAEFL